MAWLGGWARRVKISVDSGDVSAALTDFPVLIHLSASCGRDSQDLTYIFDILQADANRFKIAVTNANGVTQLYVEVEEWDDANEEAWLWCKVPSIASAVDTDIYLYYDISHPDNTNYVGDPNSAVAENVWDTNFKLVSHMRDDPDNAHVRDSTTNDNDGTKKGANEPQVLTAGKIDDAQDFDGINDYISTSFDPTVYDELSISFWMYLNAIPDANWERVIDTRDGGPINGFSFNFGSDTGGSRDNIAFAGTFFNIYSQDLVADRWYNIAGTIKLNDAKLFVDGVQVGFDVSCSLDASSQNFTIGKRATTLGNFGNVRVDEVRVSNNIRSPFWITANYESQRDDLLAFSRFELAPTDIGAFPIPPRIPIRRRFTFTIPLSATIRKSYTATLPVQINIRVPWRATITHKRPIRRKFVESFEAKRPLMTREFKRILEKTRQYLEEQR